MTIQTLNQDYVQDLLGVSILYTGTTDVLIIGVPCLVHMAMIEVTTLSGGGNLSVKLVDAATNLESPVRIAFPGVFVGRTPLVFPKPILFEVGVWAFLNQTTGAGRISVSYEVL